MALRTFEEFLTQRNFTRAVDKVPFVNGTEARRGFEAWLAYNDSKLHAKLFHSNGNPRLTARFGCVAEESWAQFLTTKSRDGKRWCNEGGKFVPRACDKKKRRERNKQARAERAHRLEQLAESVSKRPRTHEAENEGSSSDTEGA